MNDDHMAVWEAEDTSPTDWERWVAEVETIMGHDLDGNWYIDGYSLDTTHHMYESGLTPDEAARNIKVSKADVTWKPAWP